jgi:hypothetical protein
VGRKTKIKGFGKGGKEVGEEEGDTKGDDAKEVKGERGVETYLDYVFLCRGKKYYISRNISRTQHINTQKIREARDNRLGNGLKSKSLPTIRYYV